MRLIISQEIVVVKSEGVAREIIKSVSDTMSL
jgi:hypothetical protein